MVEVCIYAMWIFDDVFIEAFYRGDFICDMKSIVFCAMDFIWVFAWWARIIAYWHAMFILTSISCYITMTVALYYSYPFRVDLGVDIICIVLQAPYSWGLLAFWRQACAHFLLFVLYLYLFRLRVLHPQWYAGTRASELRCLVGG